LIFISYFDKSYYNRINGIESVDRFCYFSFDYLIIKLNKEGRGTNVKTPKR